MGAWGFGPFDNDIASDVIGSILKPIMKVSQARKPEYEKVIAVVHILLMFLDSKELESDMYAAEIWPTMLRDRLKNALDDQEWIQLWDNPNAIKAGIRRDLRKLDKWIDSGCFD